MTKKLAPSANRKRLITSLGAALLAASISGVASAEDFRIEIKGFADDIGQVVVQLYSSEISYRADVPNVVVTAPITARTSSVQFPNLNGSYAIAAFHDRDGDGIPSNLPLGVPINPTGYSQGAWNGMSRPAWDAASFSSDSEPPIQLIRLRINAVVAFAQMIAVGLPALLAVFLGLAVVRGVRRLLKPQNPLKENSND